MPGFHPPPCNDEVAPRGETSIVVQPTADRTHQRPPARGDVAQIERAIRSQNWEEARCIAIKVNLNDAI